MDYRKLQIFHQVATTGSFTRAAKDLHMAQPAVSIAIRKLEEELELTLLHRQDRKVSLTAEGRVLLKHAERITADFRQARLEMEELRGLRKGEVRVGIPSMLGSYYFPEILMAFKLRYPELQLSVIEGGARDIQNRITSGELDMGIIVRDQIPESLDAQLCLKEQMVVCVPPEHRFAERESVSFQDFFDEQLVLFKESYFHREFINRLSREVGHEPQVAFETNLIALIRAIVKKGFGITTFLKKVVDEDGELVAIPFSEPVWLDLCIAWKKGTYLSHADRQFMTFLLEQTAAERGKNA